MDRKKVNPVVLYIIGCRNSFQWGAETRTVGFRTKRENREKGLFKRGDKLIISTPILVDKDTGLPLNTGGDPRFMKLININEYYYFEIISGVIDQIEKEYKLRYRGAQRRTMEVVRMVVHHLLTSEYPLRISNTALCSKNTMRNIADRLSEVYPRMFQCLRGFPSDRGNVPSVITWRYKTREWFLTHITWNYKKHREVFDLIEYDPYAFEDKLLEESYLKNKLRR